MYQINQSSNSISPLEKKSFFDLGFKERENLQKWIARQPDIFGEELLIIQEEFSGFDETNERLDLLALDKQGSLVIIENKLDDSGRDVTWQAIKYASYCSSLSKDKIIKIYQEYLDKNHTGNKAEESISDFIKIHNFEEIELNKGFSQRIILTAAKFRKEVTSSVLWLMNFKIRLQCFTVTPFALNDALFLNVEQIIPIKDADDYMISMADKVQDDIIQKELKNRHYIRHEFWTQLIQAMEQNNTVSNLFSRKNPSNKSWIDVSAGIKGLKFAFVATRNYGQVELYIGRGAKEENERIFNELLTHKENVESDFGSALEWCKLEDKQSCRIKFDFVGNIFDRSEWQYMIDKMIDAMCRLENAFKKPLEELRKVIKEQ
jgi:hypothetical protein